MIYNFNTVNHVACAYFDVGNKENFFEQVCDILSGTSPIYGNTADSMGVDSFQLTVRLDA